MQEVELDLGMNPTSKEGRRGIDRLRLLAFRMQSIQSEAVNDPDYKDDGECPYILLPIHLLYLCSDQCSSIRTISDSNEYELYNTERDPV